MAICNFCGVRSFLEIEVGQGGNIVVVGLEL